MLPKEIVVSTDIFVPVLITMVLALLEIVISTDIFVTGTLYHGFSPFRSRDLHGHLCTGT